MIIIPPGLAVSPAPLQDAEAARQTGPEHCGDIHNLRHLIWFSIDNDDSRDLDQLRVATRQRWAAGDGAVWIYADGFKPLPTHTPRSGS